MSTLRDLKDALELILKKVNEEKVVEFDDWDFMDLAGMWHEDLIKLCKNDSRIEWHLKETGKLKKIYLLPAGKFKSLREAQESIREEPDRIGLCSMIYEVDEVHIPVIHEFLSQYISEEEKTGMPWEVFKEIMNWEHGEDEFDSIPVQVALGTTHIWMNALDILKEKVSKASYQTWLEKTTSSVEENELTIFVVNEFSREWLESNYFSMIKEAVNQVAGRNIEIKIRVPDM